MEKIFISLMSFDFVDLPYYYNTISVLVYIDQFNRKIYSDGYNLIYVVLSVLMLHAVLSWLEQTFRIDVECYYFFNYTFCYKCYVQNTKAFVVVIIN